MTARRVLQDRPDGSRSVDHIGDFDSVPSCPVTVGVVPPTLAKRVSPDLGIPSGRNCPNPIGGVAARRSRLLRFLAPWTAPGGGYEIRVGRTRLSAEVLSDDALEDLAARVVSDFWADRRRTRLNRPFYVAALLGMETTRAA